MKSSDFVSTGDRAVHMVGQFVAVCAPIKHEDKKIVVDDVEYKGRAVVPILSQVYIDFATLRTADNGTRPAGCKRAPESGGVC